MKSHKNLTDIRKGLLAWYRRHKRPLPWRENADPYRVWISEIMLQQTTVAVVMPYFERFIAAFPTVKKLAAADEDHVLGLWSGLGYYSRARNLHKAAKQIAADGRFPSNYEEWLQVPGVGPYTAAAVASIAYNESVACVDGNVSRVVTRIFDLDHDVKTKAGVAAVHENATALIDGQPPSEHNQAMMELGATVCVPRNPACLVCPVMSHCAALKAGTVAQRPVKQKQRAQEPWIWEMYIIKKGTKLALVKNENGTPWLKGTWVLPGKAAPWKKKEIPDSDFKHSITRHKIFVKLRPAPANVKNNLELKWVTAAEIEKLGVSSVVLKALRHGAR